MMSLGTINSTCLPKTHPAGAGDVEGCRRTLYQSSFVSSGSFGASLSLLLLPVFGCTLPAFGASSLSVVSCDLGFGTRFHPTISKVEPLSSLIMMLSVLLRSGERRRLAVARSCPLACDGIP